MQKVTLHTSGTGYWSDVQRGVDVTDMQLVGFEQMPDYGELRVYFDVNTWNVDKDGLIYADPRFESELFALLASQGLPANAVYYSEQGMQGDDYVSFDAETAFVRAWENKFGVKQVA